MTLAAAIMAVSNFTYAETLQDVVQEVVNSNPDIMVDKTEWAAREHAKSQAKSGWYPRIDATAGQGYELSDNQSTGNDDSLWREEAQVKLTQNLFTGMQTTNEIKRNDSRVKAQGEQLSATIENTTLQASEKYIDVLRQQKLLSLAEENLSQHETIYKQIKLRMETGVGRQSALDQTEGRLALARSNVIAEQNNYMDALANFQYVVGRPPAGDLDPVPTFGEALPGTVDEATDIAVLNNPQLKSANWDIKQAMYQCKVAKGEFSPKFTLEVERTWNNDIDGIDNINEDFVAAVRMKYNLFNGGKDLNRVRETVELVNQAKEIRNRTHRQVIESTKLSWNSYTAASSQLTFLEKHQQAMSKTRDAYVKQFNIGQRTLLDLLDTENELFEAERAYVDAQYDKVFAQYRILAVMGDLNDSIIGETTE